MTRYTHKHNLTLVALIIIATSTALVAFGSGDFFHPVGIASEKRGTAGRNQLQNLPPDLLAAVNARYGAASSNAAAPQAAQGIKLVPADGPIAEGYGFAVAVSGDTAVIGSYLDDTLGNNIGAAYVFVRSGGIWIQQAKLFPENLMDDGFGFAVAISGDTVVVGSRNFNASTVTDAGAAYVFLRTGGIWNQQKRLAATDTLPSDLFGFRVAISGDTILVSAHRQFTFVGQEAGAVYAFFRNEAGWAQQQKIIATDPSTQFDWFGLALAIEGDTMVVGARRDDTAAGVDAGSAYVFVRSSPGGSWTLQQKLTASDGVAHDLFGQSVQVSGNTIVVGVSDDDNAKGIDAGSVYVFVRNAATWTEQAKLIASDGAGGDYFGDQVALSGNTLIASAPTDDTSAGLNVGSVYVFVRDGNAWQQLRKITPSDGLAYDFFGWVALSGDTAVVGAFYDPVTIGSTNPTVDNVKSLRASAYVFTIEPDSTAPTLTVPSSITREATSAEGVAVNYSVSATDDYDPSPKIECSPQSGSTFAIGSTIVSCTATDNFGNSTTEDFTVNVVNATPSPTPNPCLAAPASSSGTLRKSVSLGAAPAVSVNEIGGPQDLLYKYRTTDSPCSTTPGELKAESDKDTAKKGDANILILKESGTTWVKLWIDWAALQPYSWFDLAAFQSYSPEKLRELESDITQNSVTRRTARFLINLDGQIRTAHKEKLQVILTLNQSYPLWANGSRDKGCQLTGNKACSLTGKADMYGPVPICDEDCRKANDRTFVGRKREPRDSYGKIPTDLGVNGPWGRWINFLVARYGITKDKIDGTRQPCSYNFNGAGCGDYFRYVDFLEIVNEPNYTHWPQRADDERDGTLVMALYVARMFRTAKAIVDKRNAELLATKDPKLDPGPTTITLLGPATADNANTNTRVTSYFEFNRELLKRLDAMDFEPGNIFAWSHHNYGDVERWRDGRPRSSDPKENETNSSAWTRRLLLVGVDGYTWNGWGGAGNPQVLITESGARLNRISEIWGIRMGDVAALKQQQAFLVSHNFYTMDAGPLSTGIAMVNNYLTYSDPAYDTGLRDFIGTLPAWRARACGLDDMGTPIVCRANTGLNGEARPVYFVWRVLQPSR